MDRRRVSIESEYVGARLADERLNLRLVSIGRSLATHPAWSFPKVMASEARLEATYRFPNNARVDNGKILEPHVLATKERCKTHPTVLAIHDTTEFIFSGNQVRAGLGPTIMNNQGFMCHATLLVAPGESRLPLGVAAVRTWTRESGRRRNMKSTRARATDPNRETVRWIEQAFETEKVLERPGVVHLMDREGDFYDLLWRLAEGDLRFVVRAKGHRKVEVAGREDELFRMAEISQLLTVRCKRRVSLSRRLHKEASCQFQIPPASRRKVGPSFVLRHEDQAEAAAICGSLFARADLRQRGLRNRRERPGGGGSHRMVPTHLGADQHEGRHSAGRRYVSVKVDDRGVF